MDKELEGQILLLKETQVKYVNVLKLAEYCSKSTKSLPMPLQI